MTETEREHQLKEYYNVNVFRWHRLNEVASTRIAHSIAEAGLRPHLLSSRVKSLPSFVDKGVKLGADGRFKYSDPQTQITDLVGVRVVVAIAEDVPALAQVVREQVKVIEDVHRGNEDEAQAPGYQSLHLVASLKDDDPALKDFPALAGEACIEIQVRSILQDAYASFLHDLVYKAERPAGARTQRQLKVLAAVLDLADREFGRVRAEHIGETEALSEDEDTHPGAWDEKSLNDVVRQYVGSDESDGRAWLMELRAILLALGFNGPKDLQAVAGSLVGGVELAARLRAKRPWLRGSQVFDALLQRAFGQTYLAKRAAGLSEAERTALEQVLKEERGEKFVEDEKEEAPA